MSEASCFYNPGIFIAGGSHRSAFNQSDSDDEEDDGENEDNAIFFRDRPYSSSSLDRSSAASIPWADDAIRKNQLDWEHVEKMLRGQEELTDETELRSEILEWQRKFPQFLGALNTESVKKSTLEVNDSLDVESFSNMTLSTFGEDDGNSDEPQIPPKRNVEEPDYTIRLLNNREKSMNPKQLELPHVKGIVGIPTINQELSINSKPLILHRRSKQSTNVRRERRLPSATASNSLSPPTPPPRKLSSRPMESMVLVPPPVSIVIDNPLIDNASNAATERKMPPIFNILETRRRFRNLAGNRSFVQLTQINHVKSAVATHHPHIIQTKQQTGWHVPLAAATVRSGFLGKRNSLNLPAINNPRPVRERCDAMDNNEHEFSYDISNPSLETTYEKQHMPHYSRGSSTNFSTSSTSNGRSISAAFGPQPQTHSEFNALYLPYNAHKFKWFK